jgi:hypothetical protein
LRFWREGEQTRWEITHLEGELQVLGLHYDWLQFLVNLANLLCSVK